MRGVNRRSKDIDLAIAITCRKRHVIAMEFGEYLEIVRGVPVFESAILLTGEVDAIDVHIHYAKDLRGRWDRFNLKSI